MAAGREDFEAFVAARYGALLRTAYLLTGDHHDAEDLLQQALVKAVGAWGRITGDPEPYVRTILVRQNVSRWRGRRWREVHTAEPPGGRRQRRRRRRPDRAAARPRRRWRRGSGR